MKNWLKEQIFSQAWYGYTDHYKSDGNKETYDKFYGNKKYYKTTSLSTNYCEEWVKVDAKEKIFLDYACGNGFNAIKADKAGAKLSIGLDISDVSINNARKLAKKNGVSHNTKFTQGDCENTTFKINGFAVYIWTS